MASIRSYKNGAGGSSGADLAILPGVLTSGVFWYVGSATPGASDSNAGTERTKPLLTTGQAYTNAAAGDTVVWLPYHAEVFATAITIAHAGMSFVGEGTGGAVPRLTLSSGNIVLDINAAGILVDNAYFPASTAAQTARVQVRAASSILNALQFDCGVEDTNPALSYISGGNSGRLTNSRFTSVASGASIAIDVSGATTDWTVDNLTVDAGSFGWATRAVSLDGSPTRIRMTRVYLLNGSGITAATGTTGIIQVAGSSGDAQVNWTP